MSWLTPRSSLASRLGWPIEDEVVVFGEVLEEQPQLAQVGQVHQVGVVEDGGQALAGVVEAEGLLDEPAFALEGGAFELDAEGLAEDLDGVGVGVQGAPDGGDQVLVFGVSSRASRLASTFLPVQSNAASGSCFAVFWEWSARSGPDRRAGKRFAYIAGDRSIAQRGDQIGLAEWLSLKCPQDAASSVSVNPAASTTRSSTAPSTAPQLGPGGRPDESVAQCGNRSSLRQ